MGFFDLFKNKNSNPGSKPRTVKKQDGAFTGQDLSLSRHAGDHESFDQGNTTPDFGDAFS